MDEIPDVCSSPIYRYREVRKSYAENPEGCIAGMGRLPNFAFGGSSLALGAHPASGLTSLAASEDLWSLSI